jgi:PilZ domain
MTDAGERREFFRVRDRLEIEFRVVDHTEFLRLEHIVKYNPTQVFMQPHNDKNKQSKPSYGPDGETLASFLAMLDRKLSVITDLLTKSCADDLYTRRYVDIEISGSGLSFVSDVPLPEDGYAEFRLMLPVFPYPKIPVLCRVVRSVKREDNSDVDWEIACKFLAINDSDRDLLVQYVFGREREQIRSGKGLEDR